MNNYIRILDYLNKFAGDGKYYELHTLFEELFPSGSSAADKLLSIYNQPDLYVDFDLLAELLAKDGLIIKKGSMAISIKITSNPKTDDFVVPKSIAKLLEINDFNFDKRSFLSKWFFKKNHYVALMYEPLMAQITPLGIKYLKDMVFPNTSLNETPSTNQINQIISLSKDLVKEGRIAFSIENLLKIGLIDDHQNILLMLLGRISLVEKDDLKGVISSEEKRLEINKITDALLRIVGQIEKFKYDN